MEFKTTVRHMDHDKNHNSTELLRLALDRSRKSGNFDYLSYLSIGTPSVSFRALIDSVDALTWTQCATCHIRSAQPTSLFNPMKSTSYATLKCPNEKCKLFNYNGCDKRPSGTTCMYNLLYGDGSWTQGDLATETLWYEADKVPVPRVLFGCAYHSFGDPVNRGAGNLGLGQWNETFGSQLDVCTFSYFLPLLGSKETDNVLFVSLPIKRRPVSLEPNGGRQYENASKSSGETNVLFHRPKPKFPAPPFTGSLKL
ncbi:Eukaryotic aspartyl protease family protein [Striga hermonthica]|uniref:Eukaryotic aspartyl protease family protein n=1 Tax=Striga hermonthica TaxID=68872 RepID=A0A9N7P145_STRHE|nr:Eukaryotic aspartyl protease family protein [Striga hermonthica]